MVYTHKMLPCSHCNCTFIFSEGEQEFFAQRNLLNLPKKCPNCRVLARIKRAGGEAQTATVECSDCGAVTIVPFKPKGHKPVYCSDCYRTASKCDVLVLFEEGLQPIS